MIDKDKLLARLEELRSRMPDDAPLLDLMDEVEGWAAPHRKLESPTMPDTLTPDELERTRAQLKRPTFRANTPAMGLVADSLLAHIDATRASVETLLRLVDAGVPMDSAAVLAILRGEQPREVVARGNHETGYQGVIIVGGEDRLLCPHRDHKTTAEARECVERQAQDILDSGTFI